MTSIGWYAFWNCRNLSTITFEGDAPAIAVTAFYGVTATAYYPADNDTWTEDVMKNYGGTITWVAADEEYRINSITIWDSNGASLSAVPAGTSLATISVTNLASEGNTLIFLAAYSSTGQYQGMMWDSVEDLPVGATIKITLPVNNSGGEIENLEAFTVASFSNPIPLGKSVSFLP